MFFYLLPWGIVNCICEVDLYDLKNDPGETKNRADNPAYQAVRKELSTELDKWLKRSKSEEG